MTAIELLKKIDKHIVRHTGGYCVTQDLETLKGYVQEALASLQAPAGELSNDLSLLIRKYSGGPGLALDETSQDLLQNVRVKLNRQAAEAERDHKALNDLADGNLRLKEENKRLRKALGNNEPWPLLACARQLVLSADHLLNDHNCDSDGYEKTEIAKRQMRKHINNLEQALKG